MGKASRKGTDGTLPPFNKRASRIPQTPNSLWWDQTFLKSERGYPVCVFHSTHPLPSVAVPFPFLTLKPVDTAATDNCRQEVKWDMYIDVTSPHPNCYMSVCILKTIICYPVPEEWDKSKSNEKIFQLKTIMLISIGTLGALVLRPLRIQVSILLALKKMSMLSFVSMYNYY